MKPPNTTKRFQQPIPDDLHAIRRLLIDCGLPADDLTEEHLDQYLIVLGGGEVIATGGLELCPPDALLRSLAVDERYRGQGLGVGLVRQLEHRAGTQGIRRLFLLSTTAVNFFQSLGYNVVNQGDVPEAIRDTAEFRVLCPGDATCMTKRLREK